jgi:hypothetical protein
MRYTTNSRSNRRYIQTRKYLGRKTTGCIRYEATVMQQAGGVQEIIQEVQRSSVWRGVLEVHPFLTYLRLSKTSNQQRANRWAHSVGFFLRYKQIEHPNSIIRIPALYMGSPTLSEFLGRFLSPSKQMRNYTIFHFQFSVNFVLVHYGVVLPGMRPLNVSEELCASIFRIKYNAADFMCIIHHLWRYAVTYQNNTKCK